MRFASGLEKLHADDVEVDITMCNSGGRSMACLAKLASDELASRFRAFYEIDRTGDEYVHPKFGIHLAGLGGLQGSAYNGVCNGSAGYPGRQVAGRSVNGWIQGKPGGPSVSWRDAGLPVFSPETSCNLPDMTPTP